jgi:regulator of sigma E protease
LALAYGLGYPEPRLQVQEVVDGSPAQVSGFQAGDVLVEVNGQKVSSIEDFRDQTTKLGGQQVQITVDRQGEPVQLTTVPRANPPANQGALGVRIGAELGGPPTRHGPVESVAFGFKSAVRFITMTLQTPVMLLQGLISPEAARPICLPGMTQVAAGAAVASVKSGWLYPLLVITGAFSAGLAVANMLPIPALDGGRLAFVIVEAIRGRRVSPEREGLIHVVGMAVLISLMVFISIHDLMAPPPAIDWGIR